MPSPRNFSVAIALLVCAVTFPSQAQDWSAAQMEVWGRIVECTDFFTDQNHEAMLDCIHDDFSGWLYGEPIPRSKSNYETIGRFFVDNVKTAAHEMRPLEIMVLGNVAVVHYYGFTIYEGSMNVVQDKWTDIMLKEDGTWRWIADHGGTLPSGN